jgi:hypothetical protein
MVYAVENRVSYKAGACPFRECVEVVNRNILWSIRQSELLGYLGRQGNPEATESLCRPRKLE